MIGRVISENDPPYFVLWVILAYQSWKISEALNKPWIFRVCCTSVLRTLWEKEKLLKFEIVICQLPLWKRLKFVVWERVNWKLYCYLPVTVQKKSFDNPNWNCIGVSNILFSERNYSVKGEELKHFTWLLIQQAGDWGMLRLEAAWSVSIIIFNPFPHIYDWTSLRNKTFKNNM